MPVVIDLLSSPNLPVVTKPKVNTAAPKRALTFEAPKPQNDGWFDLSSDDIALPSTKARSARLPASAQPVTKVNGASKPPQPAKPVKGNDDFYFLSDDFDTTLSPLNAPAGKASVPTKAPKSNLNAVSKPNAPVYGLSTGSHFKFLSDDFDRTNVDDPFASDGPASKKRRLSPSPKATSSKNTISKKAVFKRTSSNIEYSSKASTALEKSAAGMRRTKSAVLESDPIMFTSSPDPFEDAAKRRKEKRKETLYEDDEEVDLFGLGPSKNNAKSSASGSKILESSNGIKSNAFTVEDSSDLELPDIDSLTSQPKAKPPKSSQATLAKYNADKAKEKAAKEKVNKKKEKDAAKEAEKDQKRIAKEQKARDKDKAAEMAKVNTLKTDKKVSAPEMIVDIPSCLETKLAGQTRNFLTPLQIEYNEWESTLPVVKWRRKAVAEWNEDMGLWEPVPQRIKTEKHVMCVLSAKEFVELATGDEGQDVDAHVLRLRAKFHSSEIIYMIEGLRAWMRKNVNLKNRQFTAAVRSHLSQEEQATTASQKAKKKKKEQEYVDENIIEDALLNLQVIHGTLIHHTNAMIETAEWIVAFTQHISTIPYKARMQSLDTAFCMESGQVKTGENPSDTYTKMLQEIRMITAPIAYGIAAEYPTVQKLVKGLEENGPLALEDCRKCANKDGAFTDRRIGPSISKRVYKVFMGRDAGSWDV